MEKIIQFLKALGYTTVDKSYYSMIRLWERWYKGRVPSVHNYIQYNGKTRIKRCRKSLGMAKKVCEDWANLLLNEKVEIKADDEEIDAAVADVLEYNKFHTYVNQLIEKAFAVGTGALVEYTDGDDIIIDYISAQSIFPLAWDNGDITECAFASERKVGDERFVYINIHRIGEDKNYIIENRYAKVDRTKLVEVDLPEGIADVVETRSPIPRFQIIYPNIANNVDMASPLGISVYANALDQLETCDVIFDSLYNEFNLGRKRIMVPLSMVRIMLEQSDGDTIPVFDENDLVFYAYQTDDKTQKIDEMNGELRIDAHVKGLNEAVNMCGYKCGFGEHKYRFEGSGTITATKTATEVISEESDLFRSVKKHEAVIASAIRGLYKAVAVMLGFTTDFTVSIDFDDSIIEDKATEQARDRQDVVDGIMSKVEYRIKWYHETETDALAKLQGISSEDAIMGF